MPELTLTKTHLQEGVWEGVLTADGAGNYQPEVTVTHLEKPIEGVTVSEDSDHGIWTIRVPIPVATLSDGVQTFLIFDGASNTKLSDFTLIAGEAVADDIRAEVELLRAELDMLKRAFRRHCLETG